MYRAHSRSAAALSIIALLLLAIGTGLLYRAWRQHEVAQMLAIHHAETGSTKDRSSGIGGISINTSRSVATIVPIR